jgi:hypothetical protein
MNFIAGLFMIVDAILRIVNFWSGTFKGDVFFYIMTFYLFGFAALLFASEWRAPHVLLYAEFLRGRLGKGFYLFLVGLLIFDDTRKVDMLIGILLVLSGIFNVIVSFMRRDPDEEEEVIEESSEEYEDDEMYGEEVGEDQVIEKIKGKATMKEGYQSIMEFTQDEM